MASLEALRTACRDGDVVCIRRYLTLKGPDLFVQDKSFYPANSCLWLCAERGHSEALGYLVRAGWSISGECETADGVSPLYVAAQNGHVEAARVLLEYGADVESERASSTGATALYVASQQGHADVVRLLLQQGARVDHGTRDGVTPLMVASYQGHVPCVVQLLRAGADSQRTARGQTVRQWAAAGGHGQELDVALQRAAAYRRHRTEPSSHALGENPRRGAPSRRVPPIPPSALISAADELGEAVRADTAAHRARTQHLRTEVEKKQRGEPNVFTVHTVQEVEQIQAAWEAYKTRLTAEAQAHVATSAHRQLTPHA